MEKEIIDLPDKPDFPQENRFLKVIAICRWVLASYIVINYIGSVLSLFEATYSDPAHKMEDLFSVLFNGLVYFLFVYYLITQGLNEFKFQKLIHQRKILKIFALIINFLYILPAFPRLVYTFIRGFNVSIYTIQVLILLTSLLIFYQDFKYVLKRKVKF